jgi:hypothetical protein
LLSSGKFLFPTQEFVGFVLLLVELISWKYLPTGTYLVHLLSHAKHFGGGGRE